LPDDPARKVQPGPGALDDRGGPPLFPDVDDWGYSEAISIRLLALGDDLVAAQAEMRAAVLKADKAERLVELLNAAEAAKAAEADEAAEAVKAAKAEIIEASMREAVARKVYDFALAAGAGATLALDAGDLAASGEFDPYNLARSLAAGSPGRLGSRSRLLSGRLRPITLDSLELAFWLAAGGLAEPPPPERLRLDPRLWSLVLAARAAPPARALAAIELARGGSARRIPEALERHLDSLPGLARAEAEAVPGKVLAFDGPIPEAPASEVFQTLLRVTGSFSGRRRVIMGLVHLAGLSFGETARCLAVDPLAIHNELRHGYKRLAGDIKAYLTRLAVARGHGLTDFPGLDRLRGRRPALSPVPSRGELPERPAPPALEPPQGADSPSAVKLESAELARRLVILSPDGLDTCLKPVFDLAYWLSAAGLAEPPEAAIPPPGRGRPGRPRLTPEGPRSIPAPSSFVAPPPSEALGFLTRALEGFSGRRRLIIRLLFREGLDTLEVGRRLGMTTRHALSERSVALRALADQLRDYLLDPAWTPGRPAAGRPGLDPLGGD
jgi:DNA-directed RNA polymerase specialized sigma24 family protein